MKEELICGYKQNRKYLQHFFLSPDLLHSFSNSSPSVPPLSQC